MAFSDREQGVWLSGREGIVTESCWRGLRGERRKEASGETLGRGRRWGEGLVVRSGEGGMWMAAGREGDGGKASVWGRVGGWAGAEVVRAVMKTGGIWGAGPCECV